MNVKKNNGKKKEQKIEEKSLIDELIELKFKKEERTPRNIGPFIEQLVAEVMEIVGDDEEGDDDDSLEDGFNQRIDKDVPDDMTPFVVIKKNTTFLDYKCPKCQHEDKLSILKFDRLPYKVVACSKCNQEFLVKLGFEPSLKPYVEANGGNPSSTL